MVSAAHHRAARRYDVDLSGFPDDHTQPGRMCHAARSFRAGLEQPLLIGVPPPAAHIRP